MRFCTPFDSTADPAQKARILHHFLCDFRVAGHLLPVEIFFMKIL